MRESSSGLGHGIHALVLVTRPFCYEDGLQTPTFQLRRAQIEKRFDEELRGIV